MKDACTLHRWYLDSYKGQMADDSTLKLSMNTNSAYIGLTHPMNPADGGRVLGGFGGLGGLGAGFRCFVFHPFFFGLFFCYEKWFVCCCFPSFNFQA